MKDVNFDCPACRQNLDAPEDMVGLFIECPSCGKVIKIPTHGESAKAKVDNEFAPPPPRPPAVEEKSSTMRLDLPADLGIPRPQQRKVFIRRTK